MHRKHFSLPQSLDICFNGDFRKFCFIDSILYLQRCISFYQDDFTKACKCTFLLKILGTTRFTLVENLSIFCVKPGLGSFNPTVSQINFILQDFDFSSSSPNLGNGKLWLTRLPLKVVH